MLWKTHEIEQDESIEFLGFVEDERQIVSKAQIFVVPLRIGGGTRLKILNALSMGKCVVSTSIGCEGLNVKHDKNIIIADDPVTFAREIIALFKTPQKIKQIGNDGRELAKSDYEWEKISKKMNSLYNELKLTI